jgi:hypothetical protein
MDEDGGIARPYCVDHHEDRTVPDLGLRWNCIVQFVLGLVVDYGLGDETIVVESKTGQRFFP